MAQARTWVEISGQALGINLTSLRSLLAPQTVLCAVVKANAYGHGLEVIGRLLNKEKVEILAVDNVDELLLLRTVAPQAKIFVLGTTINERLSEVVQANGIQTISSPEALNNLTNAARSVGRKAGISLKIETGLNRQGLDNRELETVVGQLPKAGEWIEVVSVASHLANSEDIEQQAQTKAQLRIFENTLSYLKTQGVIPKYRHIACSAAALTSQESRQDMVRFGIALYGLWPSEAVKRQVIFGKQQVDLVPVLSWKTRVVQIKNIPPGSRVGYGGTFLANRPLRVAVLPVGYYDGYDRGLSGKGEVIVRGVRCPVLGRVCMNMMMVDVSQVPGLRAQEMVTLLGKDGMHSITANDLAEKIETINYEVVTRINPLLPRFVV